MSKVGKLRSRKTPETYDVLDEHFYSRHPHIVLMDDTSIGQNCEIDPQLSDDWKKGRRVVELSVLAEKMFCTMCNTRLHFADTLDETKQGLCSLLTIQ